MTPDLGKVGIWSRSFSNMPAGRLREVVPAIEDLGFRTLWYSESFGREAMTSAALILAAGRRTVAASGIAVIWARDATAMINGARSLAEAYPGRFVLGIGVSHLPSTTRRGWAYEQPYTHMAEYLEAMDRADYAGPRPPEEPPVLLAALGPKMLALAARRADGAHPYFVPVEHTRRAREVLGHGPLLAPEQAFVLSTDPERARSIAREHAATYLAMPNYRNNLLRLGWNPEDLDNGGSDALIDAVVAWGDAEAVRRRVQEHLAAGADHVSVQVLGTGPGDYPIDQLTEIAPALRDL